MDKIQMVDLLKQYKRYQKQIDDAILSVISSSKFINGPAVKEFKQNLSAFLGIHHVIPCANGTDALQIALMALELQPGDEVILPAFSYISTIEVVVLLGLKPVLVDVNPTDFNLDSNKLEQAITAKTKVVIPVHLFGQAADMSPIVAIAKNHKLFIIEDAAQSIGASYKFKKGKPVFLGGIGDIGCFSFFPSKNLGAYGDGGCICTHNDELAKKIKLLANHGQTKKYYHETTGVNSRLDTIQAAILNVKVKYLPEFIQQRREVAKFYHKHLSSVPGIILPEIFSDRSHVYHQFTVRIPGQRDKLQTFLKAKNIPSTIYYPLAFHQQKGYSHLFQDLKFPESERLCREVLSLPMHTEMTESQLFYIAVAIQQYFKSK